MLVNKNINKLFQRINDGNKEIWTHSAVHNPNNMGSRCTDIAIKCGT
jgi:hypothetical protein